jgi:hypothetical protein
MAAERRGNLFEALSGSYGAHGRFDAQARPRSVHLWINLHRAAALGLATAGIAGVLLLLRLLRVL